MSKIEQIAEEIDLRFQSGNSIPVSDVRLKREEWDELRALLAERDALRESGRFLLNQIKDSSCVTYTGSKAVNLHAYKEFEAKLNATPAGEDLRVSEGERG